MNRFTTREVTLLASAIAILFVQEQVLSFLPSVQFTVLLLFVYSRTFGFEKTTIIIVSHVLLDNIYMGSIGMINIVIPMTLSYMLIPISFHFIFKDNDDLMKLGIFAYVFGHLYGLIYLPFQVVLLKQPPLVYFMADLPFQFVMAIVNLLLVIWLYGPLTQVVLKLLNQYQTESVFEK
jgi:hypothetical protein